MTAADLTTMGAAAVRELALRHRGPIVAPAERPHWYEVTFVFFDRNHAVTSVGLVCPAIPQGVVPMRDLGEGTYVATLALPAATRVKYHFCPKWNDGDAFPLVFSPTNRRIDHFNPRSDQVSIPSIRARMVDSILTLPGAAPDPATDRRQELRHGSVECHQFGSAVFGHTKQIAVYRPAEAPARDCPVVLLLESVDEWGTPASVFDQMQGPGKLRPFIGVSVGGGRFGSRMRDLGRRDGAWGRFLRHELMPMIGASGQWTVAGFSAGAVGALSAALDLPDVLPNVVLLSGAFHLTERMEVTLPHGAGEDATARCEAAPSLPARAYLATGQYEQRGGATDYATTARLAGVLAQRGVTIRLDTGPTSHDTISARVYLSAALQWLIAG